MAEDSKIFVGNLAWSATSEDLKAEFSNFGTVVTATVVTDRESNRSRGFGFVEFEDRDAAQRAIAQYGMDLLGRPVTIREAVKKQNSGPRRDHGGSGSGSGSGGGGGSGRNFRGDRGRSNRDSSSDFRRGDRRREKKSWSPEEY
jgi:cold-inducible RNA-binding protein